MNQPKIKQIIEDLFPLHVISISHLVFARLWKVKVLRGVFKSGSQNERDIRHLITPTRHISKMKNIKANAANIRIWLINGQHLLLE